MGDIKFGTSGFRGIIAENMTKENIQKIAYAVVRYIKKYGKTKEVFPLGFDNRFLGKNYAIWFAEVLVSYGIEVLFFEKSTPSTLIAFETKNRFLGAHITASHNPYYYNGLKIFQTNGRETTTEQNTFFEEIANNINYKDIKITDYEEAINSKKIIISNNIKNYCNSIIRNVNAKKIQNANLSIYFNAMNGSTVECARFIFNKLNVKCKILNGNVDYSFGGHLPAPYKENLKDNIALSKADKTENISFAVDGDGDRVNILDESGNFFDCNYISALIYYYFLKYKKIKGDFVKNCALTEIINILAKKYHTKTYDAKVGFKNIADILVKNKNAIMGAETNGVAIKSHILHKDGLMTAVLVLEILANLQKPIGVLINELKKELNFPCESLEFSYPHTVKQKQQITEKIFIKKILPCLPFKIISTSYEDGFKIYFENNYWCVIRFSGNENVIRLFTEMKDKRAGNKVIKCLEEYIGLSVRQ